MLTDQSTIQVLIADDHPTIRAGIRAILDQTLDIQVVGEAEDGFHLEKMIAELHPHILLLELVMPGPALAQLEKIIRDNFPKIITLVLTAHDHDAYLVRSMDAGASGFFSKTETGENLISAIRRAASGASLFTEEQFERATHWRRQTEKKWGSLTLREGQILRLLVEGCDNKCIAETLGITAKTVAYHVTNILKKLDVKSRCEAGAWVHKYLPDNLE